MALTQKEKDQILSYFVGVKRKPPRPMKLICVSGKIVADATVIVSPSDPNWYRHAFERVSFNGVVQIRRL